MSKIPSTLKKFFVKVFGYLDPRRSLDFALWFFEDAAFILLPIAVIVSAKFLSTGRVDILYLSPEWSFATIVLFGTTITKLIRLKTEIQQDFSERLYGGTRLYILFLIASVLVLSLVIFKESGFPTNSLPLWAAQMGLLLFSLFSLYAGHKAEVKNSQVERRLPSDMGRGYYFNVIDVRLGRLHNEIRTIRYALHKHQDIQFRRSVSNSDTRFWEKARRADLTQRYRTIKKEFLEIEAALTKLVKSPIPEPALENMPKPASKSKLGKKY